MTTGYVDSIDTPDGTFTVILVDNKVIASGWATHHLTLLSRVHSRLIPEIILPANVESAAIAAVRRYYDGDVHAIDTVRVHQQSGPFIEAAWQALRTIPAGETKTYTELAGLAGRTEAVRAAASACAKNAVLLFVPCHRVVNKDETLGNYSYGVELKRRLLAHESTHTQAAH